MAKAKDLTGQRFGRLTVIRRAENSKRGHAKWFCVCDCGKQVIVWGTSLQTGNTKSCGCYAKEKQREQHLIHSGNGTRLYRTWMSMKRRCDTSTVKNYADYGGRGINVCDEWLHNFEAFRNWSLENGYADDLTIDRINVDGDYCPDNCRWSTQLEQQNNKRNNHYEVFNGETHTLAEWQKITGIPQATIRGRLKRGWTIERALTTPTKKR